MRFSASLVVLIVILLPNKGALAQGATKPSHSSVTVPMSLDQGRVVIDIDLLLPDGATESVRGWVDNGNPDLYMNRRVANLLGFSASCDGELCTGTPPSQNSSLAIGGMRIPLSPLKEARVFASAPALAPGMSAEINIPASLLRNYDVVFDFPDREFTIALAGRLKLDGVKNKMLVNGSNGLIRIPSRIENKNADLALDLGSSANFLSVELFDKLSNAHPNSPHLTGAVGPFNSGELDSEPKWRLMRVDRMQFGPLFLTDVAVAEPANDSRNRSSLFEQHSGNTIAGLLGTEALINYRVGFDYAHAAIYFDIGRTVRFPDFDVVGLILRPEGDTGFSIAGIADFEGTPSVRTGEAGVQVGDHLIAVNDNPVAELTLGQVWSLLEGSPGQQRKLAIARGGKPYTVVATVQHFLGETPRNDDKEKPKR
jgi:hypothetical protein